MKDSQRATKLKEGSRPNGEPREGQCWWPCGGHAVATRPVLSQLVARGKGAKGQRGGAGSGREAGEIGERTEAPTPFSASNG